MELFVLLLALLGGLLLLLVRGHSKTCGRLPPGPRPLPLLGNLLQMDREGLLKSFIQLREKYGDVFTVHLGPRPVVMLCGTETIREALVDQAEAFSGRGTVAVIEQVVQGYGVIFANGKRWKTLRRFSLATMRDFGMGKRSVEERIKDEAQCLVEELRKSQGAPLDPTFIFQCITANIICSIVFGERFDYKDPQFLRLMELFYQTFALASSFSSQLFELFSGFLKYFPGTHTQICKNVQEVLDYIGHSVEKHRANLDPSAPRDFIDAYLIRMEEEKANKHTEFHHQNLLISVLSLFFAGTETSSTTLRYGFLLMLKYPQVAEKVQKEIDQVIGSHRLPTLDDRTKMPYTEAVIHEVQRFSDLIPMSLPHKVTKDTLFRGYLLPKDTEVYPILSSALHDPQYFEQPDAFNPDHFLDANGALKKSEAFIPFSIELETPREARFKKIILHNTAPSLEKQESARALAKASPATSCSFSSPPSSRTSPCPAPWTLRTSTSLPRTVASAKYPQHTRSASWPAADCTKAGGGGGLGVCTSVHNSPSFCLRKTCP